MLKFPSRKPKPIPNDKQQEKESKDVQEFESRTLYSLCADLLSIDDLSIPLRVGLQRTMMIKAHRQTKKGAKYTFPKGTFSVYRLKETNPTPYGRTHLLALNAAANALVEEDLNRVKEMWGVKDDQKVVLARKNTVLNEVGDVQTEVYAYECSLIPSPYTPDNGLGDNSYDNTSPSDTHYEVLGVQASLISWKKDDVLRFAFVDVNPCYTADQYLMPKVTFQRKPTTEWVDVFSGCDDVVKTE